MSKGYADYLVAMAREIDRDFQRDADGVEVPMFDSDYKEWLKTSEKLAEGSRVNYLRWLRKADAWICESDRDFWTLLKKAWEASDFETARNLCKEYESQLLEEKAQAKKEGKEEFGESSHEIECWLSAFRKYCNFFEEQMQKAESDKRVMSEMIEKSRQSSKQLFLTTPFILWGIAKGYAEDTVESYVSDIKRINRELFSKTGHDILSEYLPGFVKSKNSAKINEMFGAMDDKLTERINNLDETEMPVKILGNCLTALRRYAEFINSIINQS